MRMRTGIGDLGSQRNGHPHGGPQRAGFYLEFSPQLGHSFAHAKDSDAQTGSGAVPALDGVLAHPTASIADVEADASGITAQVNLGGLRSGMALNVGQAFLHDTEERRLG